MFPPGFNGRGCKTNCDQRLHQKVEGVVEWLTPTNMNISSYCGGNSSTAGQNLAIKLVIYSNLAGQRVIFARPICHHPPYTDHEVRFLLIIITQLFLSFQYRAAFAHMPTLPSSISGLASLLPPESTLTLSTPFMIQLHGTN